MALSVVRRLRVFLGGRAHMQVDKFFALVVGSLRVVFRAGASAIRGQKRSKLFGVGKEVFSPGFGEVRLFWCPSEIRE